MITYLYHLHRTTNDNLKQGYIGITNRPTTRLTEHKRSTNKHLENAFKKYSDIVMSIIYQGTQQECLDKEYQLRPTKNIGWNIAVGGGMPPSSKGKPHCIGNLKPEQRRKNYKHSVETKAKLLLTNRANADTLSLARRGKGNPNHGKTGIDNPNFKGYYHTPSGRFESCKAAADANGVSRTSIQRRCIKGSDKWLQLGWRFEDG